ncbi:MAG: glutamate racemase [Pseudomonadota bacterium]
MTVGVFDSGVGGLSVLRALLAEMPQVAFVYVADSGFAPYGERSAQAVKDRASRITRHLVQQHQMDALVVACNTATALAIEDLRHSYPQLPIVGVEPALKTAASLTRSGHVGVLATRGTLHSERFARLRRHIEAATAHAVHFICQPCDGLADAIERDDPATTWQLCQRYLEALQTQTPTAIDTLVLGCTHYPFAADVLQELAGTGVQLVETGAPVARRTRSVLALHSPHAEAGHAAPRLQLLSTGDPAMLTQAARRWLGTQAVATALVC